ncbi:MAG: hypothetical protein KDA44_17335 [Planctomycetales bacterium]|nr:hypothetical protein [Planctomycetales bacterium]
MNSTSVEVNSRSPAAETPAGVACGACGAVAPVERRFCGQCGAQLWDPCLCCGERNGAGERFCGGCGADLPALLAARQAELQEALDKSAPLAAMGRYLDALQLVKGVTLSEHSALAEQTAEIQRRIAAYPAEREQAIKDAKTAGEEARQLMAARRIDEAHARLTRIPAGFHTPEMRDLAAEVSQLVAEAKQLRSEIAAALKAQRFDGLLPQVERLVALYPDDPQPQALLKKVQAYQQRRDAGAAQQYLKLAHAAIAKCDYPQAAAAAAQVPLDGLSEDAAKTLDAIRERVWLFEHLQSEPYATAAVVKMAERFAKLQARDPRAAKMLAAAQQRYAAQAKANKPLPAPWAKAPATSGLGMPVDLAAPPAELATTHARQRELAPQLLVAYGLALHAAGQAAYPLHLTPKDRRGSWLALAPKLRSSKTLPTAWGVDVGSRVLKAVQMGLAGETLQVLQTVDIALPRSGDAAEAIAAFTAEHDLSALTVAINLPSTQTLSRFFELPAPKPEKFRDAIAFELKARIPLGEDQTLHDYHWTPLADAADDAPSSMLRRVTLVAAAREHVERRMQPWRECGAAEILVVSDSVALVNGLIGPFEPASGKAQGKHAPPPAPLPPQVAETAFLEMGANTFNLIAFTPAGLWFRGLYLGAEGLDKAIAAETRTTLDEAEALRCRPYRAAAMYKLAAALGSEFDRLHAGVHRALDQLAAETAFTPQRLLVCGGLAHQLGWLQRLQRGD